MLSVRTLPKDLIDIILAYAVATEKHIRLIAALKHLVTHAKQLSNVCGPSLHSKYKTKKHYEVEETLLNMPRRYIKRVCKIAMIFHHRYRLSGIEQSNMSALSWLRWLRKDVLFDLQKHFAE
jgi:hypothetical protein